MTDARKRAREILDEHCKMFAPGVSNHIDAMLAFAAEERKAELEQCAKICRDQAIPMKGSVGNLVDFSLGWIEQCAAAIERTDNDG